VDWQSTVFQIGYFDNRAKEARNAVAGDKQRAWTNPAFDKEAQLLQEDYVRMPKKEIRMYAKCVFGEELEKGRQSAEDWTRQ
jgi:hypothetical protein